MQGRTRGTAWRNVPTVMRAQAELASAVTLVQFDHRRFGMSSTGEFSMKPEELALDIEAVVSACSSDPVALMGRGHSGMAAMSYALSHPGLYLPPDPREHLRRRACVP